MPPGTPPSCSIWSWSYAGPPLASELVWAWPILMPKIGMISAPRITRATVAATQRHRTTRRAHAVQARDGLSSCRIRGQSTFGPMPPEQRRQQREDDGGADQRDEHSAEAHAAQQRHRDDEQRTQADGHGPRTGDHRVTGVVHGDHDGVVVVAAVRALLAPAVDDQQRVVDRDAQADESDEELHDEADVGDVGAEQHDRERREDRDCGDEQRHEREERREQEQQHREGPEATQQRLEEQARRLRVVGALGQQVVAGDAEVEPGVRRSPSPGSGCIATSGPTSVKLSNGFG